VLDPLDVTSDHAGVPLLDEDYLVRSTTHSAKGREWRSVFGAERLRRCIPSDLATDANAEIEKERRLLYVAMTRARDELQLLIAQRFFTHGQRAYGDRHVCAARSRFIRDELLGLFNRTAWPAAAAGGRAGEAAYSA
jgi:DNA helicase-2/ATP-dependent DNA helicase PcrA